MSELAASCKSSYRLQAEASKLLDIDHVLFYYLAILSWAVWIEQSHFNSATADMKPNSMPLLTKACEKASKAS